MIPGVKYTRVEWITACAVVLLFVTSCQAKATQTLPPGADHAATRTAIPQEIIQPPAATTAAAEEIKTLPPMVVLTQPTPQMPPLQVTTTAGVSKPSLVQIESPGPGSKVRDYIVVRANVYPGDKGNVNLLLTGEDGRVIAESPLVYSQWKGGWLSIAENLYFTPAAASEKALLSVYTLDWYGRITAWSSVEMLLLQVGPEEIEVPGFHGDPFVINKPQPGSAASGGTLHLEGYTHLTQEGRTTLELVDQNGSVLASQELQLPIVSPAQGYAAFTTDIGYQVQKRTPVRVILKQASPVFNGQTLAASSLILFLDP